MVGKDLGMDRPRFPITQNIKADEYGDTVTQQMRSPRFRSVRKFIFQGSVMFYEMNLRGLQDCFILP